MNFSEIFSHLKTGKKVYRNKWRTHADTYMKNLFIVIEKRFDYNCFVLFRFSDRLEMYDKGYLDIDEILADDWEVLSAEQEKEIIDKYLNITNQ